MILLTLNHAEGDIARWEKSGDKLTLTHRASLEEPCDFTRYHVNTFRGFPPPEFAVAPGERLAPKPVDTPPAAA